MNHKYFNQFLSIYPKPLITYKKSNIKLIFKKKVKAVNVSNPSALNYTVNVSQMEICVYQVADASPVKIQKNFKKHVSMFSKFYIKRRIKLQRT